MSENRHQKRTDLIHKMGFQRDATSVAWININGKTIFKEDALYEMPDEWFNERISVRNITNFWFVFTKEADLKLSDDELKKFLGLDIKSI
jgi:hypothetical protein